MSAISKAIDKTPVWFHGPILIIGMMFLIFFVPTVFVILLVAGTHHIPFLNDIVQNVTGQ